MATYDELLALDNKLKIHQRYLEFLAIGICKSKNKLNPSFMRKKYRIFTEKEYFSLNSKH